MYQYGSLSFEASHMNASPGAIMFGSFPVDLNLDLNKPILGHITMEKGI